MLDDRKYKHLLSQTNELRRTIVEMMGYGKAHHFGGSLSAVEIITALYFYKMRYDPSNPQWTDRDRFVMSKGHSVPAQYAALAMMGVLPSDCLKTLKQLGSILQGHPNAHLTPGIEAFTGSLGQGLSFANGIAIAARLQQKQIRVYVLLGDGELHEGQVWEAAMTTSTQKLSMLTAIIDNNRLKSQGKVSDAKELEPLALKWEAFGWYPICIDGHDLRQICNALDVAENIQDKPTVIIAKTIKGKGVSFMEEHFEFHNAPIDQDQWIQAMKELAERR
jgi:transketolase